MNRKLITLFALIITLTATIFYFIQNSRDNAFNALFIGLYLTVSLYLVLRILFYFRYKATLNELFFLIFGNVISGAILLLNPYVPLATNPIYTVALTVSKNSNIQLSVSIISLLALPYFLFSIILQVRSFTKYEFFRFSPTSEKGPKAEWVALLSFFVFGSLFLIIGTITSDLIGLFFGFFYIFNGIIFLFAK